jgi:putative DNA primase/helicase
MQPERVQIDDYKVLGEVDKPSANGAKPVVVDPPGAPLPNARRFIADRYSHDDRDLLVYRGGAFQQWDGTCWPEVEDAELRAAVYAYFENALYLEKNKDGDLEQKPFRPTRHKVADIDDALRAVTHVPQTVTPPAWLDVPGTMPADECVSCANGILHVPSRTLIAHTPNFYVHHSVPFAFDPAARRPTRWLAFLDELWGDDDESKDTLGEIFGYMVAGDTRQQKMFLLVGPKRSGKGTIARVLKAMVGVHNVAGPTISGLATNFGMQELIGKAVAIVSDARLRSDQEILTERLLSISGEDTLTIDRKYRDPWTGRLPTRFLIMTNELPRLKDSSGALASRFIMLQFSVSFFGRENPNLTDELLEDLPGILNWSLDGLERLRARGRFMQPAAALEALQELEDLGSPTAAFVRDRCTVGAGHEVLVDALYDAWKGWCSDQGRDHPGTKQTFGRDLRAAVPGLRMTKPRTGEERIRKYQGIALGHPDNNAQDRGPLRPNRSDGRVGHDGPRSTPLLSENDEPF